MPGQPLALESMAAAASGEKSPIAKALRPLSQTLYGLKAGSHFTFLLSLL